MKVFGYKKASKDLMELKEVSFQCNIIELDKIIEFLQHIKHEHSKVGLKSEICHSHFRDWNDKWTQDSTDIIVVTNLND